MNKKMQVKMVPIRIFEVQKQKPRAGREIK